MSAVSPGSLVDLLLQVLAEAVVGHAAMDLDAHVRDVGELDRVVLARPDRLGEVLADLLGVDVEGGDELDVADVIAAEVHVHQAGNLLGGVGVLVVLDALDEAVGAVADADDRDADLAVVRVDAVGAGAVSVRRAVTGAHVVESSFRGAGSGLKLPRRDAWLHAVHKLRSLRDLERRGAASARARRAARP